MLDLENFKLSDDYITSTHTNYVRNKKISSYYSRLYKEEGEKVLKNKADNTLACCRSWRIRQYKQLSCKEVEKVFLCHDKFCNNCKKVMQAARSMKFLSSLETHKDNLYHLTLTVPSVSAKDLRSTIKKMFKSFTKLVNLMNLNGKCKSELNGNRGTGVFMENINFIRYGYKGALRSLEVTWFINKEGQVMYHPHLHVALVLEDFVMHKKNRLVEPYSYKKNCDDVFPFSDDDIFFQRVWYLIYNNIPVNKKNVEEIWRIRKKLKDGVIGKYLNIGYSCCLMKFDSGKYAELFKYMVKEVDYEKNILSYETFKTLYYSLKNVRQLQGYGCLFNIKDDGYETEINQIEEYLNEYLLNYKSKVKYEHIEDVRRNIIVKKELYISKHKIFAYLKDKKSCGAVPSAPSEKEKYQKIVEEFTETYNLMKNVMRGKNPDKEYRKDEVKKNEY